METSSTPLATVVDPALPTPMATACAIPHEVLWVHQTPSGLQLQSDEATEDNWQLAFYDDATGRLWRQTVRATRTTMESATQKTPALAHWMCAVVCNGPGAVYSNAVAKTLRPVRATATAMYTRRDRRMRRRLRLQTPIKNGICDDVEESLCGGPGTVWSPSLDWVLGVGIGGDCPTDLDGQWEHRSSADLLIFLTQFGQNCSTPWRWSESIHL